MARPLVKTYGLVELQGALTRMGISAANLTATNEVAAKVVAKQARKIVPVRTGRLLATIGTSATRKSGFVNAGAGIPPYAGPIHFGWPRHNIEGQPFLYDALREKRSEVIGVYAARVAALVVRVGRETP